MRAARYSIIRQRDVRRAFWEDTAAMFGPQDFRRQRGWTQNDYPATVRCAFVDYIDTLCREGIISEALAARVTL